jgi:rod shape-determining protein MreD
MNKNRWGKTTLYLMFFSFFIILLQQTLFNFQFFDNKKPELFTILIVNYAFWEEDKYRGYFLASIVGFFEDVLTNQIFGLNIFLKSGIFLLVYLLKDKIFFNNTFFKTIITVFTNFLEFGAIYFLSVMFSFYSFNPFEKSIYGYLSVYVVVASLFILFLDKIFKKYVENNES